MDTDLSLFDNLKISESLEEVDVQKKDNQQALIESRANGLEKMQFDDLEELVMGSTQEEVKNVEDVEKEPMKTYKKEDIFQEVVEYFHGDELAAGVWIDKYALKNDEGQLMERNPDEMHHRMAREFARIEKKYANPMSEELIYSLFKNFKYVIPQGSPMAGIGNNFQISSLSNCFVIGNDARSDSYGGIMKMDEEQVHHPLFLELHLHML